MAQLPTSCAQIDPTRWCPLRVTHHDECCLVMASSIQDRRAARVFGGLVKLRVDSSGRQLLQRSVSRLLCVPGPPLRVLRVNLCHGREPPWCWCHAEDNRGPTCCVGELSGQFQGVDCLRAGREADKNGHGAVLSFSREWCVPTGNKKPKQRPTTTRIRRLFSRLTRITRGGRPSPAGSAQPGTREPRNHTLDSG